MQEKFDTSLVRTNERLSYWREAVCRNLVGVTCRTIDDAPFSGKLQATNSNDHVVARLSGGVHESIRTRRPKRDLRDDFFVLFYQLQGQMGVALNNDEFVLRPNEFYFYDSRHSHRLIFQEHFSHVALRVPRSKLRSRWLDLSQMGSFKYASRNNAMASLIGSNIQTLASNAKQLSTDQLEIAFDSVLDLFSANIHDQTQSRDLALVEQTNTIHARALTHIARHLADEKLAPDSIALQLGISRRYLDQLFQSKGESVSDRIQSLRLKKCAQELRTPAGNTLNISDIAFSWGFSNAAHFSKCFRRKFGMTPREYRENGISFESRS